MGILFTIYNFFICIEPQTFNNFSIALGIDELTTRNLYQLDTTWQHCISFTYTLYKLYQSLKLLKYLNRLENVMTIE